MIALFWIPIIATIIFIIAGIGFLLLDDTDSGFAFFLVMIMVITFSTFVTMWPAAGYQQYYANIGHEIEARYQISNAEQVNDDVSSGYVFRYVKDNRVCKSTFDEPDGEWIIMPNTTYCGAPFK